LAGREQLTAPRQRQSAGISASRFHSLLDVEVWLRIGTLENVDDQTGVSWNHFDEWLSRLDAVRRASAAPA
jgi:hypothetical protein